MKNEIEIKIVMLMTMLLTLMCGCATQTSIVRDAIINLRIVDDEGTPVEGVSCKILSMAGYDTPTVLSDTNGVCSVQLKNIHSEIMGWFYKHGYYKSNGTFWKLDQTSWNSKLQIYTNMVPPADNLYTIKLKRIIEPAPMPYIQIQKIVPRNDEPIGFDLEIGDWVLPDGMGIKSDLFFSNEMEYESIDNFDSYVTVSFSNALCGIQSFFYPKRSSSTPIRSELPPPQVAPESGYENNLHLFFFKP